MSKRRKGLSGTSEEGIFARYKSLPPDATKTKLIKTGVEVGSAVVGGALAAAIGKHSPWLGLGVILSGNLLGDKTGISSTIGTGMFVHGVAKFLENLEKSKSVEGFSLAGEAGSMKARLVEFKDGLLASFYLDKLIAKKSVDGIEQDGEEIGSLEAIDLSALDMFEDFNQQEADEFEARRNPQIESAPMDISVDGYLGAQNKDFSYAFIDDEDELPDL